ncbi:MULTISPECIES: hypothetical protein [Pseudoalteromonas]|uniref:hypothetical protein n=1 Tax=Pseudoalteromonas TaxID=53246 RepID=UPI0003612DCE|nr:MULTISPECIES: hypothetical protein [Pseudoalteromonas]MCF6146730.1 hypothetical protein [Pseudoalteromonas mariniglutinosa NCIMB 1770]
MTQLQRTPFTELPCVDQALSPWQSNIMAGNYAFERGALLEARDKYTTAHTLASRLLSQFSQAKICQLVLTAIEHCCPALVVAAHNLADTYKAMNQTEQACQWLCDVHITLSHLCQHPCQTVRTVVVHHHHKTYIELVQFAKSHSHYPQLIAQINNTLSYTPDQTATVH